MTQPPSAPRLPGGWCCCSFACNGTLLFIGLGRFPQSFHHTQQSDELHNKLFCVQGRAIANDGLSTGCITSVEYAPGAFRSLVRILPTSHFSGATSAQIPWACVHAGALHCTCADNGAHSTQVGAVLEQIPRMFAETKVLDSCFGGAVEAAIEVCQACWAPDGYHSWSFSVSALQAPSDMYRGHANAANRQCGPLYAPIQFNLPTLFCRALSLSVILFAATALCACVGCLSLHAVHWLIHCTHFNSKACTSAWLQPHWPISSGLACGLP